MDIPAPNKLGILVVKAVMTHVWCWKQQENPQSFFKGTMDVIGPRNNIFFVGMMLFRIRVKLSNQWDDFDINTEAIFAPLDGPGCQ